MKFLFFSLSNMARIAEVSEEFANVLTFDKNCQETHAIIANEENQVEEANEEQEKLIMHPHLLNAHFKPQTKAPNFHSNGKLKGVQAIVLAAGTGSRMTTLVTATHKCLLPIATIPMLYFPLHMLQVSGFSECLVIISSGTEAAVAAIAEDYGLTIKLTIHSVDPDEDAGTLDSIRHVAGAIQDETQDVFVVSSDLVSDLNLCEMLKCHRYKGAAITVLTAPLNQHDFGATPGLKQKSNIGPDIVFESLSEQRLFGSVCGGDYEDQLIVPDYQCGRGTILVGMDEVDAHLYILSTRLLKEYVLSNSSPCAEMASLKAEVIPHLIRLQHRIVRSDDYEAAVCSVPPPFSRVMRGYNGSGARSQHSQRWPGSAGGRACYTHHYTGLCVRANTIAAYWHLNRLVPGVLSLLCPDCCLSPSNHSNSDVSPRAVVKSSLLGHGCLLSERCTVSGSSLSGGCSVTQGCRVAGSVLLPGVAVAAGTVLENCLVCCTIEQEHCILKNCIVASSRALQSGRTVCSDTLEATQFFSA